MQVLYILIHNLKLSYKYATITNKSFEIETLKIAYPMVFECIAHLVKNIKKATDENWKK